MLTGVLVGGSQGFMVQQIRRRCGLGKRAIIYFSLRIKKMRIQNKDFSNKIKDGGMNVVLKGGQGIVSCQN